MNSDQPFISVIIPAFEEERYFLDADTHMPEELLQRIHHPLAPADCVGGAVDTEYRPKKRSIRVYLDLWRMLGRADGVGRL
jgi:hypothetical protein